ncbi:hypothetical protein PQQ87_03420 [Paraburkholderia nemoris]|uniref:hypothetical protein n=1 Tax=Paraburkholderia nemoris TaxID=2793076 RepID=UPI0038BDD81A
MAGSAALNIEVSSQERPDLRDNHCVMVKCPPFWEGGKRDACAILFGKKKTRGQTR